MKYPKGKLKLYGSLLLLIGLTGCAAKLYPADGYRDLQQKKPSSGFRAAAVPITFGKEYKTVLKTTDSVVVYDTLGTRSYYKNFTVALQQDKTYKVSLSSVCNCFGFDKYMLQPALQVADGKGTPVKARPYEQASFDYRFGPLTLNTSYVFESFDDSAHTLSVFSQNDHLDQPIFKYYTVPIPMNININKTLVGTFYLKIEEITP